MARTSFCRAKPTNRLLLSGAWPARTGARLLPECTTGQVGILLGVPRGDCGRLAGQNERTRPAPGRDSQNAAPKCPVRRGDAVQTACRATATHACAAECQAQR